MSANMTLAPRRAALLALLLRVATGSPIFRIPLDKQYVPIVRNGATVAHKTAYFGKVHLGSPASQAFSVVFDTGSGHFFLPSMACESAPCSKHRRFDRLASTSAEDINHDGSLVGADESERDEVSVVYGTGSISGGFIRDKVCLHDVGAAGEQNSSNASAGRGCAKVRVVLAQEMTEEPFGAFEFDGVVGLGLEALALDPEFSFFGQMAATGGLADARFGYFLSKSDHVPSEIAFGGFDAARVASELEWSPVHRSELGFWQVKIRSISIGGKVVEDCREGCSAIADTGTSLIGVPKSAMRSVHLQLARKVPGDPDELDCRDFPGPEMVFELEGGVRLSLGPEDYSRAAAMRVVQSSTQRAQVICRASLMLVEADPALGAKTWILGEPVLQKYYTAYDWSERRVGFALAAQPSMAEADIAGERHVVGASPDKAMAPALIRI